MDSNLLITEIQTEQPWWKADNPFVYYNAILLSDNGGYMVNVKYRPKFPATQEFYNWVFDKFKNKV